MRGGQTWEDLARMFDYYLGRADWLLEHEAEYSAERAETILIGALHLAGLPVNDYPVTTYWTWRERHLYTDELRAWSEAHKRQRTGLTRA